MTKYRVKWKPVLAIGGGVLLLLLILGVTLSFWRTTPSKVYVSNVTSTSASISWVSEKASPGMVIVKEGESSLPFVVGSFYGDKVAYDDRDYSKAELKAAEETLENAAESNGAVYGRDIVTDINVKDMGKYNVHHVTVTNLDPEKEYTFWVGDGKVFRSAKTEFTDSRTFKTFAQQKSIDVPDPSYGVIVENTETGEVSDDAIVYLYVDFGDDKLSQVLSSPTAENGSWYIDLSNAKDVEGNSIGRIEDGLTEIVRVEAGPMGAIRYYEASSSADAPMETLFIYTGEESNVESSNGVLDKAAGALSSLASPVLADCQSACVSSCKSGCTGEYAESCRGGCNSACSSSNHCGGGGGETENGNYIPPEQNQNNNSNGGSSSGGSSNNGNSGGGSNACNGGGSCTYIGQTHSYTEGGVPKSCTCNSGCACIVNSSSGSGAAGQEGAASNPSGAVTNPADCQYGVSTIQAGRVICKSAPTTGNTGSSSGCSYPGQSCGNGGRGSCGGDLKCYEPTTSNSGSSEPENGNESGSPEEAQEQPAGRGSRGEEAGSAEKTATNTNSGQITVTVDGFEDIIQYGTDVIVAGSEAYQGALGVRAAFQTAKDTVLGAPALILGDLGQNAREFKNEVFDLAREHANSFISSSNDTISGATATVEAVPTAWEKFKSSLVNFANTTGGGIPLPAVKIEAGTGSNSLVSRAYAQVETEKVIIDPKTGMVLIEEAGLYTIVYKDETYIFYAPGEMDGAMFFIDSNANSIYDQDETILSDGADLSELKVSKVRAEYKYDLKAGYNFVSFPFILSSEDGMNDASEFLSFLNGAYGDSFYSIARYDGSWKVAEQNSGNETNPYEFQIVPGIGYVLRTSRDVTITLTGQEVIYETAEDKAPVFLQDNWNLVSVYGSNAESYTAESWLDSINAYEETDFTAVNVSRWSIPKTRYEGLQKEADDQGTTQVYGFDFPISQFEAYFVRITEGEGTWEPELAE
jgi:hypothetical protein